MSAKPNKKTANNREIRTKVNEPTFKALEIEARSKGLKVTDILRMAMMDRYPKPEAAGQ